MNRVRSVIGIGVLLILLSASPLIAGTITEAMPDPVRDCPKGLVCFTIPEAAQIDRKLIQYERDLSLARAKKPKRFGLTFGVGCGIGVSAGAGLQASVGPNCGISGVWGIRF